MDRTTITAAVVSEAQRMLDAGAEHDTIAGRLGLTRYVVRILARNRHIRIRGQVCQSVLRRIPKTQYGIDTTTIHMMRWMFDRLVP